ncbi:MAG: ferrous iron transport protein A [Acholeplasmataceae bacterium]|jgi:Fe2+ transport system protein FeoA|nr:ferrous iron transport protein A [Acholeplasmataceae bacterium]MDD2260498.1 FeoA family protein [Acholeplasmataceae bacterium]MDD4204100.1 FeoA family protein [Acholeplasmataceae bacterium]MDD4468885.1 FeoA family protein [Acholeplasmataceae bacterium]MDD4824308.1 FeoA family protein [Acholeplasmataceae bacterium]
MLLSDLKINNCIKVSKIASDDLIVKHRLNDLGITKGVEITIIGYAPLGDPVNIRLRGYNLAIEKKYLNLIQGDLI